MNDILIRDAKGVDIISPNVQIVELMIISPEKYKTLNISKMKDKNITTTKKTYQKMPPNDQIIIQPNHIKKNSCVNNLIQDNISLDQISSTFERNNKYNSREENNNDNNININYSSNYYSNKSIANNSNSNRERNSFAKTSKVLQPQKSLGNNPTSHTSNNPINILNNTTNKGNTVPYTNNIPNRSIPQSNDSTYMKKNNKYNSVFSNNDLLNDPIDTNSSNANNYFLNSETIKIPISNKTYSNVNNKAQRGFKDNDKMSLNLKDNPIEVRYKSEKRIYRQHDPNTDSNTITGNLLKSGNYLGTENSIENDEFLFYNNVNRKTNSSNSTPNIVNYSECSNNLNFGNNRQSKQKQSSNIKSFKQQRTFNEDLLEDNDYCSNNAFS